MTLNRDSANAEHVEHAEQLFRQCSAAPATAVQHCTSGSPASRSAIVSLLSAGAEYLLNARICPARLQRVPERLSFWRAVMIQDCLCALARRDARKGVLRVEQLHLTRLRNHRSREREGWL